MQFHAQNVMKKEYEKPIVETVIFEYDVKADTTSIAEGQTDVGRWWEY